MPCVLGPTLARPRLSHLIRPPDETLALASRPVRSAPSRGLAEEESRVQWWRQLPAKSLERLGKRGRRLRGRHLRFPASRECCPAVVFSIRREALLRPAFSKRARCGGGNSDDCAPRSPKVVSRKVGNESISSLSRSSDGSERHEPRSVSAPPPPTPPPCSPAPPTTISLAALTGERAHRTNWALKLFRRSRDARDRLCAGRACSDRTGRPAP